MTILGFGPEGNEYSIYEGALGAGWFVRVGKHLVGVGRDSQHAHDIARADRLRIERERKENPVFFLAA